MSKHYFIYVLCCALLVACGNRKDGENSGLKKNEIPNERIVKGEELFKVHCITCHTLRYIEMQPAFPRITWEKVTNKMIKSFGAPIPDSSAVLIVDYLMSVKGLNE